MSCPYADSDAAYVLGALEPQEQQAFRAHLVDCERCRAAVDELAVLPGMLARLLPGADTALAASAPPAVLPSLVERVRAERRARRLRTAAVAVLAAAAAAVAGVFVGLPTQSDSGATVLTMSAAPGVPVEATLLLTGRGWGTSIDTRCRYDGSTEPEDQADGASTYELFAIDDAGESVLVSSWQQPAGPEITIAGSTWLGIDDIDRLEVRTDAGQTILTTTP